MIEELTAAALPYWEGQREVSPPSKNPQARKRLGDPNLAAIEGWIRRLEGRPYTEVAKELDEFRPALDSDILRKWRRKYGVLNFSDMVRKSRDSNQTLRTWISRRRKCRDSGQE